MKQLIHKFKTLILILIFYISLNPASGEALVTNVFWINLKNKLINYLDKVVDKSKFKYEIVGPSQEMKNFLGNRPDAEIEFLRFNPESPANKKTILARVKGSIRPEDQLSVILNYWIYKEVQVLNRNIKKNEEIYPKDIKLMKIPIEAQNARLYYEGPVMQKVALRDLRAGEAIKINMLRHEKTVRTGDNIRVLSQSPFITLEFRCRALSSGDIGDIINLFCEDIQKKNIKAKVKESGIAVLL
jgi:flagella basal body P-ring formation protein FlgA